MLKITCESEPRTASSCLLFGRALNYAIKNLARLTLPIFPSVIEPNEPTFIGRKMQSRWQDCVLDGIKVPLWL
jgi:hypothetical protein